MVGYSENHFLDFYGDYQINYYGHSPVGRDVIKSIYLRDLCVGPSQSITKYSTPYTCHSLYLL